MAEEVRVDLFAEDRAHEALLTPLITRIATERQIRIRIRVRSALGGHGRVLKELRLYQQAITEHAGVLKMPDVLVVGTDANCQGHQAARNRVLEVLLDPFRGRCAIACPDPHVERWCFVDLQAFSHAVGVTPSVPRHKCERDLYKRLLSQAVTEAGHPRMLGGIEFAREIIEKVDLYRAGKNDRSFGAFVQDLSAALGSVDSTGC